MKRDAGLEFGVQGYFTLKKYKNDKNGEPILSTVETVAHFPNLITNAGLNAIGVNAGNPIETGQVGSGNNAPAFSDTQLQSRIAYTSNRPSGIGGASGISGGAEPFAYVRTVWRFVDGQAAGNIQEVGVGQVVTNPATDPLFSRALVLDAAGDPTSITVLSDETLDLFYEFRIYLPTTDVTGSIVLEGVSYDYTIRPIDFNSRSFGAWWYALSSRAPPFNAFINQNLRWGDDPYMPCALAYAGQTLQPIDFGIRDQSGSYQSASALSLLPYTTNTFYRDMQVKFALGDGNVPGGVGKLLLSTGWFGGWQIVFTSRKVPKTDQKKWDQTFRITWARR